ncbi:LOW QUALITY PROTEIN: uncharacterized protein LOC100375148 [Saccoglossus kowalevskii]
MFGLCLRYLRRMRKGTPPYATNTITSYHLIGVVPNSNLCTVIDHRDHKQRYLKDAAAEYKDKLVANAEQLKVKENEVRDSKDTIQRMADSLKTRYRQEKKRLEIHTEKTIEEITRKIRNASKQMMDELKDEYKNREVNLKVQMKELESSENSIKYAREYTNNLMHYGNPVHLMSAKNGVTSLLTEIQTLVTKQTPVDNDDIQFIPSDYDRDRNVLVCDEGNNLLQIFTLDGNHLKLIKFTNFAKPFTPVYSAISDDGYIFTTDYYNKQVVVCDENGKLIRVFGSKEIQYPMGVAISPINGHVYVVDHGSDCVRIYSQLGVYMTSFGSSGTRDSQFNFPWDIAIGNTGNIIVSDYRNNCIQVFDNNCRLLNVFGGRGDKEGEFYGPEGVATDTDGCVYICDYGYNRVQKFDSQGKFIARIDSIEDNVSGPCGIYVSDDKPFSKVVVTEWDRGCVKVFTQ